NHVDTLGGQSLAPRQPAIRTNIRTQSTALMGRATEIAALTEAIKRSRIVTVVADRGLGKTRIAVAAVQRRLYAYPDGTWMVDCGVISDGERLESAVLGSLGVAQGREATPRAALTSALNGKNLLILFDDCERIAPKVAQLCEAIASVAPAVTMLATSAHPLGARGEEVFELLPPTQMDALALFVDRAQEASSEFEISDEGGRTILHICDLLQNVPLAIELTASRVASMSVDDILRLLESEPEARTVDGAIAWSYRLLSENARRLFERLSVFPAMFRADTARDICSGGDLEPWDVPDALDEVARANLAKKFDAQEMARYLVVEQAREYGREVLRERLERTAIQWRYIRYFRALTRRIAARLDEGRVEGGLDELLNELENVMGALEYALVRRVDVTAGADMVVAMRRFWSETGRFSEGRYWTEIALDRGIPEGELRAELLYAAALMAHYTGDIVRLEVLSKELVEYYEERDDPNALAKSLNGLANARFRMGDAENARLLYERALESYRKAENRRGAAVVLLNLGSLAVETADDPDTARRLTLESLELFRELGVSMHTGSALSNLAGCAIAAGDFAQALDYANESLIIFERLGNAAFAASQLLHVAHARIELGDREGARDALAGAQERLRREPTIRYIVQFFEVGFLYAYDEGLYELAARVLGFLDAIRAEHRLARTQASLNAGAYREGELHRRLDRLFD
ncbi:MAG: tetratricopeptide repeat protein, partial [Candidatus Eremiobacteraeota bacterium]|nr:tetratricopeptide repeat protein [Candidatus Eremiobacteraeota bacterium]